MTQGKSQTIILGGSDDSVSFGMCAPSVDIISSRLSCINSSDKRASNALIVSPTVSYDWEYNYYLYPLVACHESGYIAYFLKVVDGSPAVRLFKQDSLKHCLLKFPGGNLSVKFSNSKLPLLAVLSFDGILKIFAANESSTEPAHLLLSLCLSKDVKDVASVSLEWSPKPSQNNGSDKDQSLLLAASLNERVFLLDLNQIVAYYIDCPLVGKDEIESAEDFISKFGSSKGCLWKSFSELSGNSTNVNALAFSSDCKNFATGSQDGKVSIYQFEYSDAHSLPFREWFPHSYLPISGLFFVESMSSASPVGYLITGANWNRQLRLWRCVDYCLVQSVNFLPTETGDNYSDQTSPEPLAGSNSAVSVQPQLILCFDQTSKLLLASDVKRSVLYALDLSFPPNSLDGDIMFRCISEFLLMHPCISFDTCWITREHSQEFADISDAVDADFQNCEKFACSLALMHPKMLQTGRLCFSVPLSILKQEEELDFVPPLRTLQGAIPPTYSLAVSSDVEACSSSGDPSNMTTIEHEGATSPFFNENSEHRTNWTEDSSISSLNKSHIVSSEATVEKLLFIKASVHSLHVDADEQEYPVFSDSELMMAETKLLCSPLLPDKCEVSTPKTASLSNSVSNSINWRMSASPPSSANKSRNSSFRRQSRTLRKSFNSAPSVDAMLANSALQEPSQIGSKPSRFIGDTRSSSQVTAIQSGRAPFGELSDSVRSLMGSCSSVGGDNADSVTLSTVGDSASASLFQPTYPLVQNSLPLHPSVVGDLVSSMNKLIQESKAQNKSISTLMNKVQENKTLLNKVVATQNVILNHLSCISQKALNFTGPTAAGDPDLQTTAPSGISSVPPPTADLCGIASPPWINELMEELHAQKIYNAKRFTQFENTLKNVAASKKPVCQPSASQGPTKPNSEPSISAKGLTEQIRSIVRSELQIVFRSNLAKIVDPLRQCVIRTIEETVRPLPAMATNHMMRVLNDPKFFQFLSNNISTGVTPNMSKAYREELKRSLVPAFTSGIEKLVSDLDVVLKSGFQQHLSTTFSRIRDESTSSKEKIEAATKSFNDSINKLSKELPSIISTKVAETLSKVQKSAPQLETMSRGDIRKAGFESQPASKLSSVTHSSSSSALQEQASKQKSPYVDSDSSGPYWNAVSFIRSGLFSKALETALTTTNQSVLIRVLQELSVVHLFRQNVGQDLILSLIHQLSCGNLREQMELKVSFLQEALNHLNIHDQTVLEHGGNIIGILVKKLSSLMETPLSVAEDNRVQALCRSALELSIKIPVSRSFSSADD